MADNGNPPSTGKSSAVKNFIITVLTTILVGCGLLATFTDFFKNWFKDRTTVYRCNIHLCNGQSTSLTDIEVLLNGHPDSTDGYGDVIFFLKKNKYTLSFQFGNKPHVKYFSVISDTTLTIDIGASLSNPKTGTEIRVDLPQPNKHANQKTVKSPGAVKIISIQQGIPAEPLDSSLKKNGDNTAKGANGNMPVAAKMISANELLQKLVLKVKIDYKDPYDNRNNQFAYHYHLDGDKKDLDLIKEVMYQRNDPSFPEYKKHEYNVSADRGSGFDYAGYQWGSVTDTYVQIILQTGARSDVFLKTIFYQ